MIEFPESYYLDEDLFAKEDLLISELHQLYGEEEDSIGKKDPSMPIEGDILHKIEEEVIAEAKRRAEDIIAEAREEAERVREEARHEGYNAGRKEGRHESMEAIIPLIRTLEEAACKLDEKREELVNNAEKDLVELALGVIRKLLGEGALATEKTVITNIHKVLACTKEKKDIVIKVNNTDIKAVLSEQDELKALFEGIEEIEIIPDDNIAKGGCIVETDVGFIDARLETQMKSIEEHLSTIPA